MCPEWSPHSTPLIFFVLWSPTASQLNLFTCFSFLSVCGLEWSPQSTQLASGGNDNVLNLWEPRTNTARLTIERHCAAVLASTYTHTHTHTYRHCAVVLASTHKHSLSHTHMQALRGGACLHTQTHTHTQRHCAAVLASTHTQSHTHSLSLTHTQRHCEVVIALSCHTHPHTHTHTHTQVKALSWCPFHHNTLASGGGTADRKICLWNTSNGTCLNEVDTKSQVLI